MRSHLFATISSGLILITLSSCALLKPYQAELTQGNYIRQEQLDQLAVGQTEEQVIFLLGTPLLTGEKPTERWIYPLFDEENGYRNLVVTFNQQVVTDIQRVLAR